jgi:predicted metalloprotease with PDZ domain
MRWFFVLALAAGLFVPAAARADVEAPARGKVMLSYAGPRLGIQVVDLTEELRAHFGAERDAGVLVGKVEPGSSAEKAGIKVGDVLVSVASQRVADAHAVRRALSAHKEGDLIAVQVVRDRRPVVLSATVPKPSPASEMGFSMPPLDEMHRFGPGSGEIEKRLHAIEERLKKLETR